MVNTVVLTLPDKGTISDSTTHPVAVVAEIEDEDVDEEVVAAEEDEDLADTGANNVGNLVGCSPAGHARRRPDGHLRTAAPRGVIPRQAGLLSPSA